MIFSNLCIFLLFLISIINLLISDDGDFVCCCLILKIQHALKTGMWTYGYLLNDDVMVAVVVLLVAVAAVVVKKESNMKV